MKQPLLLFCLVFMGCAFAKAQSAKDMNAIKLYNNRDYVIDANADLPPGMADRLYRKTTQLINQTGVAEIGYSTFFIAPKLDVLSVDKSDAGMATVYLASCELYLSINRVTMNEYQKGGATFASFTKPVSGSGMSKNEAIQNALNNISGNDKEVVAFLTESKQKIDAYFKTNCDDVLKQAERALKLNDYTQAIALFFSVPASAPCYDRAMQRSEGVYTKYVEDDCNKKIIKLKAFAALAQSHENYYDSAMSVIENLGQASKNCNYEAEQIITKLESSISDKEKQKWEFQKQQLVSRTDAEKEMYKAMAEINKNYQPAPQGTNVIIAH